MTQISTDYARETVSQFHQDPTGMTVTLRNGQEVEVLRWVDTARGRRLRCRSRSGRRKWIPAHEVVGVITFTFSITGGPGAHLLERRKSQS